MLGRVLSVNVQSRSAVLSIAGDAGEESRSLTLPLGEGHGPLDIAVGDLVRLWPRAARASGGVMGGVRMSPLQGPGRRMDPTGVRSRLMRSAGRGRGGGRMGGGRGGR